MEIKNCNTSSLDVYSSPLTKKNIQHLYRRIGFSINNVKATSLVGKTATSLVDDIINEAERFPFINRPIWADWDVRDYPEDYDSRKVYLDLRFEYTGYLKSSDLRGRMDFFWSNHFVTIYQKHFCYSYQFEYLECLYRNALGNFKTFTREIGITNAMLFFLDGALNRKDNPNENYARELYELFTLGEGNGYTETDVIETSKALTGYFNGGVNYIKCSPVTFDLKYFDSSEKTIFGRKGNWDYFDVIDILFEEKGPLIAKYICTKLYEFFVHPDTQSPNPQKIINQLAEIFFDSNFEIKPVLSALFKSAHFYDENCNGVIIKSPFDLYLNMSNEINFSYNFKNFDTIEEVTRAASQRIFSPPDVAGWQRNRAWISGSLLISRWLASEGLTRNNYFGNLESLTTFALNVVGDIGNTSSNPDLIARPIIDFLLPKGLLSEADYQRAFVVFRGAVPETYYEGGATPSWTLKSWPRTHTQVYQLLLFLFREPEFQLK